jgi:hypothetical protein
LETVPCSLSLSLFLSALSLLTFPSVRPLSLSLFHSVNKKASSVFQKVENGNYAVNVAKEMGLRLVNVGGEDIVNHKMKLILAIIWQLMRKSVHLSLSLSPCLTLTPSPPGEP